jgi:hypothetical protein
MDRMGGLALTGDDSHADIGEGFDNPFSSIVEFIIHHHFS